MKKRGPQSPQAARAAWGFACAMIRKRSGHTAGALEQKFCVGDGSGRVWRTWMSGQRLARSAQRESILRIASENGWIDLSADAEPRVVLALQGLSSEPVIQDAVVRLAHPLAFRLEAPPPPDSWLLRLHAPIHVPHTPAGWEEWGANVAAATLLKDALRNEVLEKLGKPQQGPEWTAWKRACELVRSAVKVGVHEDLISSRLAALYRVAPPPILRALWPDAD